MQLIASQTIIKIYTRVYDKTLSFDLTIFGSAACKLTPVRKSGLVQHRKAFGAHRMGLHVR